MKNKLRINLIKDLLELNENLVFNTRLIKYYRNELPQIPSTAIDVGVNVGQTIDVLRKLNKDCLIHGFEPNPKLFQHLEKKYANKPNILLNKLGISNQNGSKVFHENVLHSTSSFEEFNYDSKYLSKKAKILGIKTDEFISQSYEVQTTTLLDYINSRLKTDVDILKIDTEGHEYYCLEGLFSGKLNVLVKYIQIEEHNDDQYSNKKPFREIEALLKKNGFNVNAKINHGFGEFVDVIFKNTKIA